MRLREGTGLTEVTAALVKALRIPATILPMSDHPVATMIQSGGKEIDFQEYFVAHRQADVVDGVRFAGIEGARPAAGVLDAISNAHVIILCPSNPIVSIGPILAVPGIRDAVIASPALKVGVSPIIGGRALKGPAAQMLSSLGHEPSALGVARMYDELLDVFVIDELDAALAADIQALGLRTPVLQTIMGGREDRIRLADEIVQAAQAVPVT
jgi:LPPG:FO 2-phospho-L-lactate transferase